MADDGGERPRNCRSVSESVPEDVEPEEGAPALHLDLGDDSSRLFDSNRLGNQSAGPSGIYSEPPKHREDNPFSFKHFLRSDFQSYQNKGARPKVYCEGRPVTSVSDLDLAQEPKQTRIVPEYSSALPDFVQDHLVVEQCYLGNNAPNYNLDGNLPDFTPSRDTVNINRINVDSSHRGDSNAVDTPLDLPVRPPSGFPLDLPSDRNAGEVGVSKSLPDFLADGAVRTQTEGALESPERECERLRRELENTRRLLGEQTRRAESLARELEISRSKEHDYTQNLAKALEQVEENLERSNMRSNSAENLITKLRQEIKSLTAQVNSLRMENRSLREEEGAAGGHHYEPPELHSQRLAQDLRGAASTAEHSLRQLLTGVDNLRMMAASLENLHRIEERRETFLDLDEDSGPAL